MGWFDPIDWAAPVEHAGDRPFILWSDTSTLTVLWIDVAGLICRQDHLVDVATGEILPQDVVVVSEDPISTNQVITSAQTTPTGHLLIETQELTSG